LFEYQNSIGVGIDFSEEALHVAKFNSESLGMEDRVNFIQMDWNNGLPILTHFDVVISNPPYVAENDRSKLLVDVVGYEPINALFAGPDGLREYKTIISFLAKSSNMTSNVFFEVGVNQAYVVSKMLKNAGLRDISIYPDLAGIGRCVAAKM
jgi:release factor glutamine methyltransferase